MWERTCRISATVGRREEGRKHSPLVEFDQVLTGRGIKKKGKGHLNLLRVSKTNKYWGGGEKSIKANEEALTMYCIVSNFCDANTF